ncbi:hypothetical protein [Echinimonas agarilytica]|uniref:DUF4340 domain-containing protein n=1 Tax=Echinimonas agarilytica TaxID=1215918 RepID=A0AA41W590_9GAMM|nr:hypothetical protein [Echinimonas agarilytica]MCM2679212.1 hypothetical protein [Echinimonas agarilytica]
MFESNRKVLVGSLVLALVIGVGLTLWGQSRKSAESREGILLPMLMVQSPYLKRFRVDSLEHQPWVDIQRSDNRWLVNGQSGYPANMTAMAEVIQRLSQRRILDSMPYAAELPSVATNEWDQESPAWLRLTLIGASNYHRQVWVAKPIKNSEGNWEQWVRVEKEDYNYLIDDLVFPSQFVLPDIQQWLKPIQIKLSDFSRFTVSIEDAAQHQWVFKNVKGQWLESTSSVISAPIMPDDLFALLSAVEPKSASLKQAGLKGRLSYAAKISSDDGQWIEIAFYEDGPDTWIDIRSSIDYQNSNDEWIRYLIQI